MAQDVVNVNPFLTTEVAKYGRNATNAVASATTVNLEDADGEFVSITGTTTITGIYLLPGHQRTVTFASALQITYGAATIVTPSLGNIAIAAGDVAEIYGVSANLVRIRGVSRASGGVPAVNGLAISPRAWHTGGSPAQISTDFTDATPVATEVYIAEIFVPANATLTGLANFNGSVASGNIKVGLADSNGTVVATSASTAMSGTDAYQRVPFTATYAAKGPATYFALLFVDNGTARVNCHTLGNFGAAKQTGQVYATGFTTITPATTFTTALGPVATLY